MLMTDIPFKLWAPILSNLDTKDIINLSNCNYHMYQIINHHDVWRMLFYRDYNYLLYGQELQYNEKKKLDCGCESYSDDYLCYKQKYIFYHQYKKLLLNGFNNNITKRAVLFLLFSSRLLTNDHMEIVLSKLKTKPYVDIVVCRKIVSSMCDDKMIALRYAQFIKLDYMVDVLIYMAQTNEFIIPNLFYQYKENNISQIEQIHILSDILDIITNEMRDVFLTRHERIDMIGFTWWLLSQGIEFMGQFNQYNEYERLQIAYDQNGNIKYKDPKFYRLCQLLNNFVLY